MPKTLRAVASNHCFIQMAANSMSVKNKTRQPDGHPRANTSARYLDGKVFLATMLAFREEYYADLSIWRQHMSLEINPLDDALGAEVSGVDLSQPLAEKDIATIKDAFLNHHLLCFRSDPLAANDFSVVASLFGEPQLQLIRKNRHNEVPEISVLDSTYKSDADKPADFKLNRKSGWHTDDSYFEVPAKVTLLQSMEIPESGGHTRFCNTRKAYDDLSDTEKQRVKNLKAVHAYDTMRAPARAAKRTQVEIEETPEVIHPLVRTHEDNGSKSFYFNPNRTDRIVGMERKESDALLDWVYQTITLEKYRYDHEWRTGDILVWDNRNLVHSVNVDFPVGQRRLHQRILLKGSRPQ
jgi:taurine dioxygenase